MFRNIVRILFFILLAHPMLARKIKEGIYRGVLILDEAAGIELPFNFDVAYKGKKPRIIIKNAEERITVDEIAVKGDSVIFKMPVFDTEFRTVMTNEGLEGVWINNYRTVKNIVRFRAAHGQSNRFPFTPGKANPYFEGRWEVTFSPGGSRSSKAVGIFHHIEQTDYLTGTFLTETGDYRYLEGMKSGSRLYLSCFDGSHAFLFVAEAEGENKLKGTFYSGAHWQEEWIAVKNEGFRLKDPEEITWLKNPGEPLSFSFPNIEGKTVSLSDKKYANKPVIVQLMGSWCPNCMDESRYLSEVYRTFGNEGLEIVALAFEKTPDQEKARKQVMRLKERLGIEYDILITGYTGKEKASEVMSGLNAVSAFPTTIFLNKEHRVARIHTGFSGPATGKEFDIFKERTETLIKNLIKG